MRGRNSVGDADEIEKHAESLHLCRLHARGVAECWAAAAAAVETPPPGGHMQNCSSFVNNTQVYSTKVPFLLRIIANMNHQEFYQSELIIASVQKQKDSFNTSRRQRKVKSCRNMLIMETEKWRVTMQEVIEQNQEHARSVFSNSFQTLDKTPKKQYFSIFSQR